MTVAGSLPKRSAEFRPAGRRRLTWLLAAGLLLLGSGCLWFQSAPLEFGHSAQESSTGEGYQLSADQSDLILKQGYPEAFIILFYEDEDENGSLQNVRQELWSYYLAGESYTFLNGELTSVDDLDVGDVGPLSTQSYLPEQFAAGMDVEDVLVAAGVDSFIEVPLEEQFLERGKLYYGESLAFGVADGQLRYLEALALIEE